MPREENADPAMYAINYIGRIFGYFIVGAITTGAVGLVTFEGMHLYIEKVCMIPPPLDEWGWGDEVQGWTGGRHGGTDTRLGMRARHALRAAWVCQEWGWSLTGGAIGQRETTQGEGEAAPQPGNTGYELAEMCLELAIADAKDRGLVFPPSLSVTRPPGPGVQVEVPCDPTAVDMMMVKAGLLERISRDDTLVQAKEIYETVWSTTTGDARLMYLARKVGDLCARTGQDTEAIAWWAWGLNRAGVEISMSEGKGFTMTRVEEKTKLSPPVLRATISLLVSTSAHLATTSQLQAASSLQDTARSFLPSPQSLTPPTIATAAAVLHDTWLQHRSALFALHHSSVLHALGQPALDEATTASERAESVLSAISPVPPAYAEYKSHVKTLSRDAAMLGAEAAYTQAALLERAGASLHTVAGGYQRAMELSTEESGQREEGSMGEEAKRYWRSFARVKTKLEGSEAEAENGENRPV
ncbi:MAG: hypothetical protein TREMPRED_001762 [Tremellales sp. Tagirdzhanova-0007]|nr:MAG: hypothetical protein TREMPRED_001762 [Tremellales sp. Tagirdzhanova-0007]